ncbi:DegV family protein [Clostridium sp. CF011]|uniref:DegV family protein n=1 Tax=unclassified Clostridium TaxID=2614128 RepID=UPI001C0B27CC|nr:MULTISPECIES: DegV family protein [unclassified Clostridium]MBU3092821.1 DegV family protein [Clostridium sp. CF011]MBW9146083.1 DegV family protein [Clostridium sp. CM027]UVE41741.1 DegV family protein [Clostridium sp. CM027]WAG70742.1 DegV family protein [Clostridium sp. CF011]
MAVKIVTDSTSYISEDLRKKYDISIVSLSVIFGNKEFKETLIENESFYEKLDKNLSIPTSSQPSLVEMYNMIENQVRDNNEVVGVFLSSDMSGTYSNACLAKSMILENYPNALIEIIDSRSNCMQLGFAALTAAIASQQGKSINEVVDIVKNNIKRSRFLFIPDNLEYLKKGGRIGGASALLGTIFQIKPILTVVDGKTGLFNKVRTKKRAIQTMIDKFIEDITKHGLGEVMIHHINDVEGALAFAKKVEECIGKKVDIAPIGPVIGTHVGPGALGIVYYTKTDL